MEQRLRAHQGKRGGGQVSLLHVALRPARNPPRPPTTRHVKPASQATRWTPIRWTRVHARIPTPLASKAQPTWRMQPSVRPGAAGRP